MKIALFCHPSFLGSRSLSRFAEMLAGDCRRRGHAVDRWTPRDHIHKRFAGGRLAKSKWAGYADQYVLCLTQQTQAWAERFNADAAIEGDLDIDNQVFTLDAQHRSTAQDALQADS